MKICLFLIAIFILPILVGCNKAPSPPVADSPEEAAARARNEEEFQRATRMQEVFGAKRRIAEQLQIERAKIQLGKEKHEIPEAEAKELLARLEKNAEVARLALDAGGDPHAPVNIALSTPAPEPPQMAPPGVFYLTQSARIETATGIVGLTPGTGVKLVRPGIYLTAMGEVPLSDDQVTNNMTYARQILAADRRSQDSIRAVGVAQAQQANAQEQATATQATMAATVASGTDAAARNSRIAVLTAQKQGLQTELSALQTKARDEESRRADPRRHIVATNTNDRITAITQQMTAIDVEIAKLR